MSPGEGMHACTYCALSTIRMHFTCNTRWDHAPSLLDFTQPVTVPCRAEVTDIDAIMDLLTPLAVAGITRMRSRSDILADLSSFTVVQRENKVCSSAAPSEAVAGGCYLCIKCILHAHKHPAP